MAFEITLILSTALSPSYRQLENLKISLFVKAVYRFMECKTASKNSNISFSVRPE